MNLELKDKVVLVSGSSRGIGKAIAKAFLNEGARVAVTGLEDTDIKQTSEELKGEFKNQVLIFAGDLTAAKDIKNCIDLLLKEWGTVDIFIGNIGSGKSKPVLEADRSEWQKMLNINLLGAVELANQIIPVMQKNKAGSIVFTASIAGLENIGAPAAYAAAKAALISYTKSLASALAKDNIRVNAVAPGNVKFPGGRWEEIIKEKPQIVKEVIEKEVPMKRFGSPEEIANAVVFLASEKASFITGTCLVVDGGQTRSF